MWWSTGVRGRRANKGVGVTGTGVHESRGQKELWEKKKESSLTRMDLRGTKAQFYRITFNKFHSQIMLLISERNKRGAQPPAFTRAGSFVFCRLNRHLIIGHIIISTVPFKKVSGKR